MVKKQNLLGYSVLVFIAISFYSSFARLSEKKNAIFLSAFASKYKDIFVNWIQNYGSDENELDKLKSTMSNSWKGGKEGCEVGSVMQYHFIHQILLSFISFSGYEVRTALFLMGHPSSLKGFGSLTTWLKVGRTKKVPGKLF